LTLLDVNVLIYAYHADTPQHAATAAWLEIALAGPDPIGLSWPVAWAFIRISTSARIWPTPIPAGVTVNILRELLARPNVSLIEPGPRHLEILETLITKCNATGPLVSDAVLAALAIENGAILASTDRDFSRFDNLRWINPLA